MVGTQRRPNKMVAGYDPATPAQIKHKQKGPRKSRAFFEFVTN